MKHPWYDVKLEADKPDHAEILIYTPIGKSFWDPERIDAQSFVAELQELDVSTIELRVNSPGGVVWDGVAIHNALRRHKAEVTCVVEGLCASITTVIALAADKLLMCPTSWFMIHNASIVSWGNKADLARDVEQLAKIDQAIVSAYAAKSGQDPAWIAAEMDREAWYTPDEALEHGFIDGIYEVDGDTEDALALLDTSAVALFRNAPQQLVERLQPAAGPLPTLPTSPATPIALEGVPAPAAAKAAPAQTSSPAPANTWEVDVARARRERETESD
jgi:ATP-dependent protease ClpP protease subunit